MIISTPQIPTRLCTLWNVICKAAATSVYLYSEPRSAYLTIHLLIKLKRSVLFVKSLQITQEIGFPKGRSAHVMRLAILERPMGSCLSQLWKKKIKLKTKKKKKGEKKSSGWTAPQLHFELCRAGAWQGCGRGGGGHYWPSSSRRNWNTEEKSLLA